MRTLKLALFSLSLLIALPAASAPGASEPESEQFKSLRGQVQAALAQTPQLSNATTDLSTMLKIAFYWLYRGEYAKTAEDRALEKPLFEAARSLFESIARMEKAEDPVDADDARMNLRSALSMGDFWRDHAVFYVLGTVGPQSASDELKLIVLDHIGGEAGYASIADRIFLQHSENDAFMRVRWGLSEVARLTRLAAAPSNSEIRGLCDAMLMRGFVRKSEPKLFRR